MADGEFLDRAVVLSTCAICYQPTPERLLVVYNLGLLMLR
jgi:hypothetical protein